MSEIVAYAQIAPAESGDRGAQSWWIPRLPKGVPEARHRAQEALRSWGEPPDRVETAALIVTELVANAVQHTAGRRVRCRLVRSSDGVRICVWNRGRRRVPAPSRPPMDATAPTEAAHGPGGPHGPHGPGGVHGAHHATPRRAAPDGADDIGLLPDPDGPQGPEAMKDLGAPDEAGAENTAVTSLPEDGRGLMLVDALAARWGTHSGPAGRLVWADI